MSPRSVADATRFTPTTPHAFTRPTRTPGLTGETPQQRVARLRAAAAKAKEADVSTFDKVVDRGRVWADRAHKITTFGLMTFTVLAGSITLYAITDFMLFSRRRKKEYFENLRLEKEAEAQHLLENPGSQVIAAPTATTANAGPVTVAIEEARKAEDEVPRRVRGPVEVFKEWAYKGLTPADQAFKDKLSKEAEEKARAMGGIVGAAGESVKATGENVKATGESVMEAVKQEYREKMGQEKENKGVMSRVTGWWSGK